MRHNIIDFDTDTNFNVFGAPIRECFWWNLDSYLIKHHQFSTSGIKLWDLAAMVQLMEYMHLVPILSGHWCCTVRIRKALQPIKFFIPPK